MPLVSRMRIPQVVRSTLSRGTDEGSEPAEKWESYWRVQQHRRNGQGGGSRRILWLPTLFVLFCYIWTPFSFGTQWSYGTSPPPNDVELFQSQERIIPKILRTQILWYYITLFRNSKNNFRGWFPLVITMLLMVPIFINCRPGCIYIYIYICTVGLYAQFDNQDCAYKHLLYIRWKTDE